MLRFWIHAVQPPLLVASALSFALGTGIADYLGHPLDGWKILLGFLTIWFILSGSQILSCYLDQINQGTHPFAFSKEDNKGDSPSPQILLTVVIVLLTFAVAFGYTLSRNQSNAGFVILLLAGLIITSVFFWGQPRFVYSGYGELFQSLVVCSLVPAFAFSIQANNLHQLLLPVTFPLILLFLAIMLALELESYAGDLKRERRPLLIRLGWQRGIWLQHVLLLMGFVLLSAAPLFGVAWRLVWPALLTMPLAILEIWMVNRVALGLPPRWPLLRIAAWLAFASPVYLLAITFWRA